jgi:hypothetical protein
VEVEAHPVIGAVVASAIPELGGGELGRQTGLAEAEVVDLTLGLKELVLEAGLQLEHAEILQKNVRLYNSYAVNLYSNPQINRPPKPPPVTPFTVPSR